MFDHGEGAKRVEPPKRSVRSRESSCDDARSQRSPKTPQLNPAMSSQEKAAVSVTTAAAVADVTLIKNERMNDKNKSELLKPVPAEPSKMITLAKPDAALSKNPSSSLQRPPKMRLKLSMRKLPISSHRKPTGSVQTNDPNENSDDEEVKATVVDSDDGGDDHVVAAVVGEEHTHQSQQPGAVTSSAKPKRRTASNTPRQIKLPPIASPGMFMTPPSVVLKEKIAKNGYIAPADVFNHNMELAGYTLENRTKRPHRGSSVTRTIGDMFDSNVALSLRFPPLIPPVNELNGTEDETQQTEVKTENRPTDIRQRLIDALQKKNGRIDTVNNESMPSRKRKKPLRLAEMVPVSLSITYPEEYVRQQVEYVRKVHHREKAIVEYQEALFLAQSSRSDDGSDGNGTSADTSTPRVPPIPEPPKAPNSNELVGLMQNWNHGDDRGPIVLPKGKEEFVAHLDPNCFHITEGRYFGLTTNFIADPNFVGPNAPGLAGMTASGGSGLATSSSGGGISGAMALTLSTTYNGTTAGSAAAFRGTSSVFPGSIPLSCNKSLQSGTIAATGLLEEANLLKRSSSEERRDIGPRPTANFSDLKKIFDDNGPLAQSMKERIIKSAVHASRSGHHGIAWLGPDGETYPDISKSFAFYAGVKPCHRCKSNKQGAYHCRLRRKHKEMDHDGGNSLAVISSLLVAPMESLLSTK